MKKLDWREIEYKTVVALGIVLTAWLAVVVLLLAGTMLYCAFTTVFH